MQKIAIIGAGFIGGAHAAACSNSKILDLVAVCDVNEKASKELADKLNIPHFTDAEKMLKEADIDIVDICVPTFLHKENVILAAKYGKHVICEKPVTLTLEDMDEMMAAVKKAGVKFMVAQVLRFWPEYVEIKKMYDNGDFGDVKMVYANRLAQHPNWSEWHKDPKNSGGGLFDLHLHDIDEVHHMFGPVDSVYAVGWRSDTGCYNHVISSLKFKNGVRAVVEGAFDMTENYPFTMSFRIVGETRTAEYTMTAGFNLEDVASSRRDLYVFENGKTPNKVEIDLNLDAYQAELDYFADCVENNQMPKIITPEESREVLKIIIAIQKSIETGQVVKNL
jgi:predicted dehydrogenase